MALIKHGNNALSSVTAFPSAVPTGKPVLLSTATASASASIEFTSEIDSSYDIYQFEFNSIHPSVDGQLFQFQGSINNGSSYGVTITSTFFRAHHNESDTQTILGYDGGLDLAQSTSYQSITAGVGADNDQCFNGYMYIFSPSSNVYVKHFIAKTVISEGSDYMRDDYIAGYFNDGANAINAISFKFASGNLDFGTIKMYGISAWV